MQRGRDLRYDLTLEFEEAVFGKEKEITIRRMETCTDCKGSGAAKGKARGDVYAVRRARTAAIPAGILFCGADLLGVRRDGDADRRSVHDVQRRDASADRAHDSGEGAGGCGAGYADSLLGRGRGREVCRACGDLYVVLNVKAHKFFERDGDDLHCVMPISFPQAALGTELEIQTLEGPATIKVPEGTQSGKTVKLRGKGVPHLNSHGKGDLIVEIRVQTPSKLNKAQKELLRQLSETMVVENTPTSRGLFEKVKEMFKL